MDEKTPDDDLTLAYPSDAGVVLCEFEWMIFTDEDCFDVRAPKRHIVTPAQKKEYAKNRYIIILDDTIMSMQKTLWDAVFPKFD